MKDIHNIKSQFPIFSNYPELVYLDNAATSQKPRQVTEKLNEFYTEYNSNVHRGIHTLSDKATQAYEVARENIAKFLNANQDEVVFTSGTTDSINKLARSLGKSYLKNKSILTTPIEHHSNLLPWIDVAKSKEIKLEYLKITSEYKVDLQDLKEQLEKGNIGLIAISHVSNVTGVIQPIKTIAELAHKYNALVAVDGAQASPHTEIDVANLDVDFYSFSGHKMFGPTGIGVLWGKKTLLEKLPPLEVGGGMIDRVTSDSYTTAEIPEKHEAGTPNIAGAIALSEASLFMTNIGLKEIEKYERNLTKYAFEKLSTITHINLINSTINDHTSVLSFTVDGIHPHDLAHYLNEQHIAIRTGHHCCQILHKDVLKTNATARISLSLYNTQEDIDRTVKAIIETKDIMK